ncbi:polyphosphate kinase 2 family protein [Ktedonobacteria bacterium brp13]|nr:polyphosphate kinase 2 family protein [Ktedonobacteria bacterium brp13]
MSQNLLWKVAEGDTVKLKHYDPSYISKRVERDDVTTEMNNLNKELGELQELMAAAQKNSVLIVLQGMDTSGKDGTIRHVMSSVNPQGCEVHSFKAPTDEELAHDFLWRIHNVTPGRGRMGIFNRSHYEDVLVVRVHNLVPEDVWSKRYKEINQFEKLLAQNGTIILKFFLYISSDEQVARLKARVDDKDKAWKISSSDFAERPYWDKYQDAYEAALSECSTDEAPWYIVPSNHKWYRNLAIAETLVKVMHKYKNDWTKELEARGKKELAGIQRLRDAGKLKGL